MCCGNTRNKINTTKPMCGKNPSSDVEKEREIKLEDCDKY